MTNTEITNFDLYVRLGRVEAKVDEVLALKEDVEELQSNKSWTLGACAVLSIVISLAAAIFPYLRWSN